MTTVGQIESFINKANAMIGKKIQAVTYYDSPNEDGKPQYAKWGNQFHGGLSAGVVVDCGDEDLIMLTWGSDFFENCLAIEEKLLIRANGKSWDLSSFPSWNVILNVEISDVVVYWGKFKNSRSNDLTYYPQDLQVTWKTGQTILFSASRYMPPPWDDNMFDFASELIVVFDEKVAKKYKLGSYGQYLTNPIADMEEQ